MSSISFLVTWQSGSMCSLDLPDDFLSMLDISTCLDSLSSLLYSATLDRCQMNWVILKIYSILALYLLLCNPWWNYPWKRCHSLSGYRSLHLIWVFPKLKQGRYTRHTSHHRVASPLIWKCSGGAHLYTLHYSNALTFLIAVGSVSVIRARLLLNGME